MEKNFAWLILFLAGGLEVGWAIMLKFSGGFTRWIPATIATAVSVLSVVLLGIAVKNLPIGTAYAVWTGIGVVGTAGLGILLFHEPVSGLRLLCLFLIVAGITGLRLLNH